MSMDNTLNLPLYCCHQCGKPTPEHVGPCVQCRGEAQNEDPPVADLVASMKKGPQKIMADPDLDDVMNVGTPKWQTRGEAFLGKQAANGKLFE